MKSAQVLGVFSVICLLLGCGGGGGVPTTSTVLVPTGASLAGSVPALVAGFACNENAEAALVPKVASVPYQFIPANSNVGFEIKALRVEIDGKSETLNFVIYSQVGGTALRGIALIAHGHSPRYEKAEAFDLGAENYAVAHPFLAKGFLPIVIARRGNFGSTGGRLIDFAANGMTSDYSKGLIDYSVLERAATEYQAASMTTILELLKNDVQLKLLMNQIIVVGTSGGAPTVLQFAADSQVFKSAKYRAVARVTGTDTAFDTNPDAALGARKYLSELAKKVDVPSFWLGGTDDPITSFGKLACEYKFYSDGNLSQKSMLLGSPGFGHGSDLALFSSSIYPSFKKYLENVGFTQF